MSSLRHRARLLPRYGALSSPLAHFDEEEEVAKRRQSHGRACWGSTTANSIVSVADPVAAPPLLVDCAAAKMPHQSSFFAMKKELGSVYTV
ncbi:unnamed protein product [Linum trigynum]|uniref:Uncharacterized protein n=1 Tax=Linum trigynum TaxID=586398 RepID=A0AAV2DQ50_9ROSI